MGCGPKQVRNRHRTGFFRVVNKIALSVQLGGLTDNLDRVLVGTDGTVRTQTIEHRLNRFVMGIGLPALIPVQTGVADIIMDADGKAVLRLVLIQLCINRRHHRRGKFLGGQPVTATHHQRQAGKRTIALHLRPCQRG